VIKKLTVGICAAVSILYTCLLFLLVLHKDVRFWLFYALGLLTITGLAFLMDRAIRLIKRQESRVNAAVAEHRMLYSDMQNLIQAAKSMAGQDKEEIIRRLETLAETIRFFSPVYKQVLDPLDDEIKRAIFRLSCRINEGSSRETMSVEIKEDIILLEELCGERKITEKR